VFELVGNADMDDGMIGSGEVEDKMVVGTLGVLRSHDRR
jgi:hypothetical protein